MNRPLNVIIIWIMCAISVAAAQWSMMDLAIMFGLMSNFLLIIYTGRHVGSYSNILVLFVSFSMLYGYSGPVAEMYGGGLHITFTALPATPHFITAQALALSGFLFGLVPSKRIYPEQNLRIPRTAEVALTFVVRRAKLIGGWAIGLSALASIMEISNMIRIGGISMITAGKAVYQSMEADLFLTMPSYVVAQLAFALLALSIGMGRHYSEVQERVSIRNTLTWFFVCLAPLLMVTMLLGRRGPLIAWLLILAVGITMFRPITRLRRSLLLGVVLSYVIIAFVFSNRGVFSYALNTGDWETFKAVVTDTETLVDRISPGGTEFGAAFGNYSAYVANPFPSLLFGETYVEGLVVPVPTILYPGPKPQQITYEFRDRYFAQTALLGAIAGTGFSSLLEAYMNFGYIGIFLIYALLAALLIQVERMRYRASRRLDIFPLLIYLMLLQQAQQFHRSAFGLGFGTLVLILLLIGAFRLALMTFGWDRPFRSVNSCKSVGVGSVIAN